MEERGQQKKRNNSQRFQRELEMGTTFQKPKKDIYKEKSGHQSGAAKRSIIGCPEESMGFSIREIIGDYCLSKYNRVWEQRPHWRANAR